jgi:hypothetical protein
MTSNLSYGFTCDIYSTGVILVDFNKNAIILIPEKKKDEGSEKLRASKFTSKINAND